MEDARDVLARFHEALVEEILSRRPEYLHSPFTVAEIYQNLVPYGTHRDRIGVEMNGDYEDALIRLLAGEGDYLFLDSDPALRVLREELDASNPNTGLYREFAAADVRLNPARLAGAAAGGAGESPVSVESLAPEGAGEAPRPVAGPPRPAPAGDGPEACRWCRAELPKRPNLNFCPFCGTDIHVVPCPGCGEELDPEWRFCISCGTEVGG